MQKSITTIFLAAALAAMSCNTPTEKPAAENPPPTPTQHEYAIVIHGGAGTILKKNMTKEKEAAYMQALNTALDIGEDILKKGGTSLEAVEKAIMYMEDSPLFNSGKGAVFTNAGTNELDASIMDGATQNAGAVGGVKTVRNPIQAAIAVMNNSKHVMLTGEGADKFAAEQKLTIVDNSYFHTDRRWESLQRVQQKEAEEQKRITENSENKHGTVGCVALDKNGNIVAGTSTGGMTNKRWGRVGDSPIIGAGTYADNATCGVSCTGHGEFFIRYAVAHDVAARMAYLKEDLNTAADHVVNKKLVEKGGGGGLIALDAYGNVSMPFNSEGMYRGYARPNERVVKIYKE
jgi:beta-aspartyl-peptidase (threonine type)